LRRDNLDGSDARQVIADIAINDDVGVMIAGTIIRAPRTMTILSLALPSLRRDSHFRC
jgi:hypothetical protein